MSIAVEISPEVLDCNRAVLKYEVSVPDELRQRLCQQPEKIITVPTLPRHANLNASIHSLCGGSGRHVTEVILNVLATEVKPRLLRKPVVTEADFIIMTRCPTCKEEFSWNGGGWSIT